jgi:hypothetical protein
MGTKREEVWFAVPLKMREVTTIEGVRHDIQFYRPTASGRAGGTPAPTWPVPIWEVATRTYCLGSLREPKPAQASIP